MDNTKGKQLSQNQLTILLIMLAVVVWVIGLIVSKAIFTTITFNNKVISQKRAVDRTLSENLSKVSTIHSNYQALSGKGVEPSRVLRALPTKEDSPGLASKLEALLAASSVSFNAYSLSSSSSEVISETSGPVDATGAVDAAGTGSEPRSFDFSIQVSGTYGAILQMLGNFERELSPMRILSLKVGGSEGKAS